MRTHKTLLRSLAGLCGLGLSLVQAQPDAGQSLRELETRPLPPAPSAPTLAAPQQTPGDNLEGSRVQVSGFVFSGNESIDTATLHAALRDLRGQSLSLGQLEQAAARITELYRERGWLLARALLPAQDITEGLVHIQVVESRYGEVRLRNSSGVSDRVLERTLGAVRSGAPVESGTLEQVLMTLDGLPATQVRATLGAGALLGQSDLDIVVTGLPAQGGSLSVDNFGDSYNGNYRLSGSVQRANPLGRGDQLVLRGLLSDEGQWYLRGQYDLPLGAGTTRLGLAASWMHYELGEDFKPLAASGQAGNASVFLTQHWWRQRDWGLSGTLLLEHRRLRDELGLFEFDGRRSLDNAGLSLNGYWRDGLLGGAATSYAVNWVSGRLSLDNADAQARARAGSAGRFNKLGVSLLRQQNLSTTLSLHLNLRAQWASQNLDGSEKLTLGGMWGVRSQPQGEAAGDEGVIGSLELRRAFGSAWQGGIFVDSGRMRLDADPLPDTGSNHRRRSGVGLSAYWQPPQTPWYASVIAATAIDGEKATSDTPRDVYLWVQLQRSW